MLKTLKIAIISALMLGTASAVMAQSFSQHGPKYYECQTDEGQGRFYPCDGGNV